MDDKAMKECIVVAGGAGFLGSHLCRRLVDEGHQVVCVDNFQTGRRANIEPLLGNPLFSLLRHDVINPLHYDLRPTQIYNLACAASPRLYQADPVHTLRTCVYGAFNLLELGRRTGARVLQASTSEVYGDPHMHPQSESYRGNVNMVGVRSCYDEGKRCAETLFSDYGRRKRVVVKIARIFNTYGPGMAQDDGRVVSNFVTQALKGQDLTIYGDGTQTRSLCYVDDMIEGLVSLMNSIETFQGPVNLGNPTETTVLDIAMQVRRLAGTRVSFVFEPRPADDPEQRCPDILLARRHLDWTPRTGMEEGLRKTVEYFSGVLGHTPAGAVSGLPAGSARA
ncbi:UDP-glucuronic acid decarboxylase family protein [Pusillimonas sp.]|uniref:UDP-glucuronic acid decarboxylase family protein n=1 Tax=Pusillimonas sp. TaxID=3040095 RepID=UPI0029BBBDF0|nr:UDP-glucuronic acid decarboxylase family protein [Pusillimonas sp.]MDX3894176.1 SDR family oxidoreductase [Pusillimonas sp.]